jgi:hypothetical protein
MHHHCHNRTSNPSHAAVCAAINWPTY